jgi:hypothetical protein
MQVCHEYMYEYVSELADFKYIYRKVRQYREAHLIDMTKKLPFRS